MIGTIVVPIVHGNKSTRERTAIVGWHVVGALVGGSVLGLGAATIGLALGTDALVRDHQAAAVALLAAAAVVLAAREIGWVHFPLPQRRKQVPSRWRFWRSPSKVGFMYGVGLGFGVLTFISSATFHLTLLWVGASGDLLGGVVLFGAYGAARAVPVVAGAFGGLRSRDDAEVLMGWLDRRIQRREQLGAAVLLGTAAALLGSGVA